MTERQKYFRLVADTVEVLPSSIDDQALLAGLAGSSTFLKNVRLGRAPKQLPLLVQMIEMGAPEFYIDPALRPTQGEVAADN